MPSTNKTVPWGLSHFVEGDRPGMPDWNRDCQIINDALEEVKNIRSALAPPLGRYDTYEMLKAAHPTGEAGQSYLVGVGSEPELYIWDVDQSDWVPAGNLQGTPGPNVVNEATATPFTGLIKGNGTNTEEAIPGEDYAEGVHAAQHAADGDDPFKVGDVANLPVFTGLGGTLEAKSAADAVASLGLSNTNQLINWDFRSPINQRNISSFSLGQYGLDMWLLSTGTCTLNGGTNGIKLNGNLWQRLEYAPSAYPLNGIPVTISVLLAGGIVKQVTVIPLQDGHAFGSVDGIALGLYNGANWKEFGIMTAVNTDILAVKIEAGSASTLANDLPARQADEMVKCQRFLNVIRSAPYSWVWTGMSTSGGEQTVFAIPLPRRMRIDPTASISGNIWIKVANTLKWAASPAIIVARASVSGVSLAFANATPADIGSHATLAVGSDDAVIMISAEL